MASPQRILKLVNIPYCFCFLIFFIGGTKVLREAFIEKVHLRNLRIVHGIKTKKGRNKKNMLLPSSKTTNQENKEKHCEKCCMCFYSANAGLLLTVRNVVRESEQIQYKDVPTHMFTRSENFCNLNFANHETKAKVSIHNCKIKKVFIS